MTDTGYPRESGEEKTLECEIKLEGYNAAKGDFDAEAIVYNGMASDLGELERDLEVAWNADQAAKRRVDTAQGLYDQSQNDEFPNHPRIGEIQERLEEIAAFGDMEARLDELQPILTGDEPGDVDAAWSEANLLVGMINEKAELEPELLSEKSSAMTEIETELNDAETERTETSPEYSTKLTERNALRGETVRQLDATLNLKSPAQNEAGRYNDHGCVEILGALEELEELDQMPSAF